MKAMGKPCCPHLALMLASLLPMMASCYSPKPLDGHALLRELRDSTPMPGGAGGSSLTEQEAVRQAVNDSPAVCAARSTIAQAQGDVSVARSVDNPEVRVDNGFQRRGNNNYDRDVYELDLDLRVKLPKLAQLGARVGAAKAEVAAARAETAIAETLVRQEVRTAYAMLAAARQKGRLLARLIEVRRELDRSLTRSMEGGDGVAADQAKARAGVGDAMERAGKAKEEESEALGILGRVLGREIVGTDELVLPAEPMCGTPPDNIEALTERAVTSSPKIGHRRAEQLKAQEEARAENLAWIPNFTFVEVGYSRNFLLGTREVLSGYDADIRYYSWAVHAGVGIEVPLWNWNGGEVRAAEARVEGETARFRETVVGTVSGLRRSVARWRSTHEQARNAAEFTIPAAETAMTAAKQGVDTGRMPMSDLLEAEDRLLMGQVRRMDNLLECRIAEVEVEAALGETP